MWLEFESYLQDRGSSPKTIRGYLNDLKQFATWFEITNGQERTASSGSQRHSQLEREERLFLFYI